MPGRRSRRGPRCRRRCRRSARRPTGQLVQPEAARGVAEADDAGGAVAGQLEARSCGKTGATPRPPPTSTTWPCWPMCCGRPSRPTKSSTSSPAANWSRIASVVLPSACTTTVTVPRAGGRNRPPSAGCARRPRAGAASRSGRAGGGGRSGASISTGSPARRTARGERCGP